MYVWESHDLGGEGVVAAQLHQRPHPKEGKSVLDWAKDESTQAIIALVEEALSAGGGGTNVRFLAQPVLPPPRKLAPHHTCPPQVLSIYAKTDGRVVEEEEDNIVSFPAGRNTAFVWNTIVSGQVKICKNYCVRSPGSPLPFENTSA